MKFKKITSIYENGTKTCNGVIVNKNDNFKQKYLK